MPIPAKNDDDSVEVKVRTGETLLVRYGTLLLRWVQHSQL